MGILLTPRPVAASKQAAEAAAAASSKVELDERQETCLVELARRLAAVGDQEPRTRCDERPDNQANDVPSECSSSRWSLDDYARQNRPRLLRWLQSEHFNVDLAFKRIRQHGSWWKAFGMDAFTDTDEYDETGTLFECGRDRWNRPTLVARPCAHVCTGDRTQSVLAAKRCVYTVQRCIERMPAGIEQCTLIFDTMGLGLRNLDRTFLVELIQALNYNYPCRITRYLVINNNWTMGFFWGAIAPLLDPDVRKQVIFCGEDFREPLLAFLGEDHPYFNYAIAMRKQGRAVSAITPELRDLKRAEYGRVTRGGQQQEHLHHDSPRSGLLDDGTALSGSCRASHMQAVHRRQGVMAPTNCVEVVAGCMRQRGEPKLVYL